MSKGQLDYKAASVQNIKITQSYQTLPRNCMTFTDIAVANLERGLGRCAYSSWLVLTSHAAEHAHCARLLFFVAPLKHVFRQ